MSAASTPAQSATLNTGLPGVRWIQRAIRDQTPVQIKLVSQELVTGKVRWQDPECVCLMDPEGQEWLLWRQGILYVRPQ